MPPHPHPHMGISRSDLPSDYQRKFLQRCYEQAIPYWPSRSPTSLSLSKSQRREQRKQVGDSVPSSSAAIPAPRYPSSAGQPNHARQVDGSLVPASFNPVMRATRTARPAPLNPVRTKLFCSPGPAAPCLPPSVPPYQSCESTSTAQHSTGV